MELGFVAQNPGQLHRNTNLTEPINSNVFKFSAPCASARIAGIRTRVCDARRPPDTTRTGLQRPPPIQRAGARSAYHYNGYLPGSNSTRGRREGRTGTVRHAAVARLSVRHRYIF